MHLLEAILSLLAPHDCLGCGHEGSLICSECIGLLNNVPSRCFRCLRATSGYQTCTSCLDVSWVNHVWPVTTHTNLGKQLVHSLKFSRAKAASEHIAELMAGIHALPYEGILVPVTTVGARRRQRGYDQSVLIAHALSRITGLPCNSVLKRSGTERQLGATRTERVQQLRGAYHVANKGHVLDRHIILVDDVVTTGATLESAAHALLDAGAGAVDAIVFAAA